MPGKVAVVLHEEAVGGASLSVLRAVPELQKLGWEFVFWAPSPSPIADELAARGLPVEGAWRPLVYSAVALRVPPGPMRRLRAAPAYLREFRRFVERQSPDLVHANSLYTLAEAIIARRAGTKALLHLHEMAPSGWKGRAARRLAWTKADVVVAVSRASATDMSWRGRVPRIAYEATPVPERPVAVREAPRPFVVGTVGVVSQRKGSDLFVEAARLVGEAGDPIEFRLVGALSDGPDAAWAADVLRDAERAGVRHIPRTDVFAELREWDCFVLPSRADPFPIAMLEAMASGLPVVGTKVDGIAEQIAPGTGKLVTPEDPAALADAIRSLAATDAGGRVALGAAARERVVDNFTLDLQAASLDAAYRSALG